MDGLSSTILKKYKSTRNNLALTTTHLSAYIKFGCISIREIFSCLPLNHGIIRELIL